MNKILEESIRYSGNYCILNIWSKMSCILRLNALFLKKYLKFDFRDKESIKNIVKLNEISKSVSLTKTTAVQMQQHANTWNLLLGNTFHGSILFLIHLFIDLKMVSF